MIEVAKNVDNHLSLAQTTTIWPLKKKKKKTTTIWYVMINTIFFLYQKDGESNLFRL